MGSEMCIRDRRDHHPRFTPTEDNPTRACDRSGTQCREGDRSQPPKIDPCRVARDTEDDERPEQHRSHEEAIPETGAAGRRLRGSDVWPTRLHHSVIEQPAERDHKVA